MEPAAAVGRIVTRRGLASAMARLTHEAAHSILQIARMD